MPNRQGGQGCERTHSHGGVSAVPGLLPTVGSPAAPFENQKQEPENGCKKSKILFNCTARGPRLLGVGSSMAGKPRFAWWWCMRHARGRGGCAAVDRDGCRDWGTEAQAPCPLDREEMLSKGGLPQARRQSSQERLPPQMRVKAPRNTPVSHSTPVAA